MSKISAVICVKNAELTIKKTLDSLIANQPYEIIIIDGDSTDNSLDIARRYTNKICSDEGKGLAYARQLGAENAYGDYVAYIDADAELPEKSNLNVMLQEIKKNKWVAIHAQIIDPRPNKTYWENGEDFHWRNRFNEPGIKSHLGTIVCLIQRDIILKYKFDPFFEGAAEDADFYARLKKDGYKFGVSKIVAYHYNRASFKDFTKQRIWYGKGNARAILKHKAMNLLLVPFAIAIYGTSLSLYRKKPKMIPFYIVWMIFLFYGTILGIIELIF